MRGAQRAAAVDAAQTRPHPLNASAPPDGYWIAFLDALGDVPARLPPQEFDFAAIAQELQPEADKQGRKLMQLYEVM